MTDQFNQPNINTSIPRNSREVSVDGAIVRDDDLVVVDSSANPVSLSLYQGAQCLGQHVFIKAPSGGTNSVTISAAPGETIDGAPNTVLDEDDMAIILKATVDGWAIVGGFPLGSGGGINAPDFHVIDVTTGPVVAITVQEQAGSTDWVLIGKNWDAGDPVISIQRINGAVADPTTLIGVTQTSNNPPDATQAGQIEFTLPDPIADNVGQCVLVLTRATGEQAAFPINVQPAA